MKPTSTRKFLSTSSRFTQLVLVFLDIAGMLLILIPSHIHFAGLHAPDFMLGLKLLTIVSFILTYNYLMDLYTFESSLSQLGMLERSFIAMLLTAVSVALIVYILGPAFIGGFVGRGVLASSLVGIWLYSLAIRYLLNNWFVAQRRQVEWIVMANGNISEFINHFRSRYVVERLLLLTQTAESGRDEGLPEIPAQGIEHAGTWGELDRLMRKHQIAGIVVMAPEQMSERMIEQLMTIRISGIRLFTLSDFYEKYLMRLPVFHLSQQWLAMSHGFELIHNPIGLRFKRFLDVGLALVGGVMLLPAILVVCCLILVTMGWPVLYRQERVGENGRTFWVYKFRTMVNEAEVDGAQFAIADDPRVTRLGRSLRKFRLDELPQLWNVLIGEMSFIGPRPERPEFTSRLADEIPYYNLRHIVKPGITGWAQVMYGYGDNVADSIEKLQYDLFYIKNYSLLLDISIMVRSLKVVLFGAGR